MAVPMAESRWSLAPTQSDVSLLGLLLVMELHGGPRFIGLNLEELHEVFDGGWVKVLVEG